MRLLFLCLACVLAPIGCFAEPAARPSPQILRPQIPALPPLKQATIPRTARVAPNMPLPSLASDKLAFRLIARTEAAKAKVPFDLVDAVMKIESDYIPTRMGDLDEIGLMQVRPGTAAMLGFTGEEGPLSTPAINIHYGTAYLGEAWRLAGGNVCRALMKYRAGHGNESMSPLSVAYCARAKAHLVAMGSPLASGIGDVDLVMTSPDPSPSIREPSGRRKTGAAFWTAFEARIKRINTRIEAKWKRVAAR